LDPLLPMEETGTPPEKEDAGVAFSRWEGLGSPSNAIARIVATRNPVQSRLDVYPLSRVRTDNVPSPRLLVGKNRHVGSIISPRDRYKLHLIQIEVPSVFPHTALQLEISVSP
jgi:hypothetical protein